MHFRFGGGLINTSLPTRVKFRQYNTWPTTGRADTRAVDAINTRMRAVILSCMKGKGMTRSTRCSTIWVTSTGGK